MEKVTPCSSSNSVSSPISPCSFSSEVPLPISRDDSLKFVEVHHEFLRHEWLHIIKLGDLSFLTA